VRVTLPLGKKVRKPLTALLLGDGKTLRIVSITLRIVSIYDPPYAIPRGRFGPLLTSQLRRTRVMRTIFPGGISPASCRSRTTIGTTWSPRLKVHPINSDHRRKAVLVINCEVHHQTIPILGYSSRSRSRAAGRNALHVSNEQKGLCHFRILIYPTGVCRLRSDYAARGI
jgi:hypothetical protein